MGTDFYVGCVARHDRFELGTGPWGWHYTHDPNDHDQPKMDPSIERLLLDDLHRDDRQAFAEYVVRVWNLGYVEPGQDGWIRDVGGRLYDYCVEREWAVLFIPEECDEPEWWEWPIVGSRFRSPS